MTSRERFEAWCDDCTCYRGFTLPIDKDARGHYESLLTRIANLAWSARDSEVGELVKALQKIIDLPWGWEGDCGAVSIAENAIANYESDGA